MMLNSGVVEHWPTIFPGVHALLRYQKANPKTGATGSEVAMTGTVFQHLK